MKPDTNLEELICLPIDRDAVMIAELLKVTAFAVPSLVELSSFPVFHFCIAKILIRRKNEELQ